MAHAREPIDIRTENRRADALLGRVATLGFGVGALGLVGAFGLSWPGTKDGLRGFAHSYLVSFFYFLTLSLGALFFVVMHHLTRAGWSVVVRRIAEAVAAAVPFLAVLALPVLALHGVLYPWSGFEGAGNHPETGLKATYLSVPFFLGRCVVYFLVWGLVARYYHRRSVAQDATGDPRETLRRERFSPVAMILFALTVTLASFDFLMALAPGWYSTIFGVYIFAGCAVAIQAFLAASCVWLQGRGYLRNTISTEHYHDLGKLLFAYIMFWAYIAFSQYLLIWYANLPEETAWFRPRQSGPWGWVAVGLIFGHFLIPYVALLSRHTKRRRGALVFWALWMLLLHYVDLYWIVMPQLDAARVPLSLVDLGCFLGVGGFFLAGVAMTARGRSLVPERDPRLAESLLFENA